TARAPPDVRAREDVGGAHAAWNGGVREAVGHDGPLRPVLRSRSAVRLRESRLSFGGFIMMRARKAILVLLVGGVVRLVTAPAWGGDFCIQLSSSLIAKFVGKNFKVPGKGKCKPWAGFCATGCSPGTVQTGIACTGADGSQVTFGFTTLYAGGPRQ